MVGLVVLALQLEDVLTGALELRGELKFGCLDIVVTIDPEVSLLFDVLLLVQRDI